MLQFNLSRTASSGFHDLLEDLLVDDWLSIISDVVVGLPSSLRGRGNVERCREMNRLKESVLSLSCHDTYDPLGEAVNSELGVRVDEYMVAGRCSANGLVYGLRWSMTLL